MIRAYLQLIRLPNTFTAAADVIAGYLLVSGLEIQWPVLFLLSLSSMCLYAAGVTFNDYFDYDSDLTERPERPLPAGKVSRSGALWIGVLLLLAGNGFALKVSWFGFMVSLIITGLIFLYDALFKEVPYLGPLTMAGCRFFNLILGTSVVLSFGFLPYLIALLLFNYIFALTVLSKGESGNVTRMIVFPQFITVFGIILALYLLQRFKNVFQYDMFFFLGIFSLIVFITLLKVIRRPDTKQVRWAIRNLVLGIIFFDAAIAAGASSYLYGLLVSSLILPAWALSRIINVS